MKIAIGCDHAGYQYKERIVRMLRKQAVEIVDCGTHSADSVDYPDFAHPVAEAVTNGSVDFGVLICGSGNGVAMAANKHRGARAALCWKVVIAELARQHNDANIIAIPARFVSLALAEKMVKTFLETSFERGRHERRVRKISAY